MTKMTYEEALKWIADIFEEPVGALRPETPRQAVKTWDSLGFLTLMARFDEDLSVLLEDSELQAMNSIGDVLDAMRKHGKLNGSWPQA
jgi:acyl carrier protein